MCNLQQIEKSDRYLTNLILQLKCLDLRRVLKAQIILTINSLILIRLQPKTFIPQKMNRQHIRENNTHKELQAKIPDDSHGFP